MAVVQNTLIGRAKRSIGGVTFMTWKGLNVAKSKPVSVANPNTPKQQMRRSVITQLVAIFRQIPGAIDTGFRTQAIHMSAYNAWLGANSKTPWDFSSPPSATLLPTDLVMAKGTIAVNDDYNGSADVSDAVVTLTWDPAITGPGQSLTDLSNIILFNSNTGQWYVQPIQEARSVGSADIEKTFFDFSAGNLIYAWLFFSSTTSPAVSDSQILNITATA